MPKVITAELVPVHHESQKTLTKPAVVPRHLLSKASDAEEREALDSAGEFGHYLTPDEVERTLAPFDPASPRALFLRSLWQSGGRISEVLGLRVADVDFGARTLRLRTLKQRATDKHGNRKPPKFRLVPIQVDLVGYLARHIAGLTLQGQDFVFRASAKKGKPWCVRHAAAFVKVALLAAGVDSARAHPHAFRHGHAIHAIKAGIPLAVLQANLDHSSITTTAKYLRFTLLDRRTAYEGIF